MAYFDFKIGSSYVFETYAGSILGTTFKEATCVAIMDGETALRENDVISIHANVFPSLPVGTPNSYSGYPYVKFKLKTGQSMILGMPWIKENTISLVETVNVQVTVKLNSISEADNVRRALVSNGITDFEIKILA